MHTSHLFHFVDLNIMATTAEISNDRYEYMDENSISNELKCSICRVPFREPASLRCEHTFCHQCIEHWLEENDSCPTCRRTLRSTSPRRRARARPRRVTTPIVVNQLNELLVRCNLCQEANIQRGNFDGHEKRCPKGMVPCTAADIRCEWTGTRDQLEEHLIECSFEKFRPIINSLQGQIDTSLVLHDELEKKLEEQAEDIDFLLTVINGGNIMHKKCVKPFNRCRFPLTRLRRWTPSPAYQCKLCDKEIRLRSSVALHACSNKTDIDCICRKCYANQYRPATTSAEVDDNDDDQSGTDDDNEQ